jgi:hypothetical protein
MQHEFDINKRGLCGAVGKYFIKVLENILRTKSRQTHHRRQPTDNAPLGHVSELRWELYSNIVPRPDPSITQFIQTLFVHSFYETISKPKLYHSTIFISSVRSHLLPVLCGLGLPN